MQRRVRDTVVRGRTCLLSTLLCGLLASTSALAGNVGGTPTPHASPRGVTEQCIILNAIPGGHYSDQDHSQEQAFCAIDFYRGDRGLCPKVFSTSPGTLIYDLSRGEFADNANAFEAQQCATSSPVKRGALGEPVSYKMTMNSTDTSATFSTASLLYYHFSRYLDAHVHVPVSVYRSMDKKTHLDRVTRRGLELSGRRKGAAMNHAGWRLLEAAERDPAAYRPTDELFTADREQVYGVLLHPHGDRYGAEINGTRKSGWGAGQNRDFQRTAPFFALRSPAPLPEAIEQGIQTAAEDPQMRQAMRHGATPEQMVFWMQELTEITLLDYIFSQQDRIGNIDYLSYWYWVQDGELKQAPASSTQVPEDIARYHPLRLKRTQLNDNDAGGRVAYANYSKTTGMLENLRHYNADTYRRLMRLAQDLSDQGELYRYLLDSFGLTSRQINQVVKNTQQAAEIMRKQCKSGALRFDLDPSAYLVNGRAPETHIECGG